MTNKIDAILSLVPDAQVSIQDNEQIVWFNYQEPPVTDAQIDSEIARLQAEYDAAEYQRQRSAEYPPITDYLDGMVKGDQTQIDKYIADCQAVKAKYPKA